MNSITSISSKYKGNTNKNLSTHITLVIFGCLVYFPYRLYPNALEGHFIVSGILLFWSLLLVDKEKDYFGIDLYDVLWISFLLIQSISLFFSLDRTLSLNQLNQYFLLFLIWRLGRCVFSLLNREQIYRIFLLLSAIALISCIRFKYNANYKSSYLLLLLPILGYGLDKSLINRFIPTLLIFGCILYIFSGQSQSPKILLLLFGVLYILFSVFKNSKFYYYPYVVLVFLFLVAICYLYSIYGPNWYIYIWNRIHIELNDRFNLWFFTFDMFGDSPWLGVGTANWRLNIYRYTYTNHFHAHNIYIQFLAENGLCGLVSFLAIPIMSFKEWNTNHRTDRFLSSMLVSVLLFLILGLLYGTIQLQFLKYSSIAFMYFFFCGCLVGPGKHSLVPIKFGKIAFFIFSLSGLFWFSANYVENLKYKNNLALANSQPSQAEYKLYLPITRNWVSRRISYQEHLSDFYYRKGQLEMSIEYTNEACNKMPNNMNLSFKLATRYLEQNRYELAIELLEAIPTEQTVQITRLNFLIDQYDPKSAIHAGILQRFRNAILPVKAMY